ncbi:MAG: hypothetical protein KDA97_13965 [Acidimicrobiales bacterium]|nr:hypothetical protein [Acidimicrobiales bacterium]
MTVIEDTVEAAGDLATQAAEEVIDVAADVAGYAVEAIVEGVDAASEAVSDVVEAVKKDRSILLRLLVIAGLVAVAVIVYKRLSATDDAGTVDAAGTVEPLDAASA